MNISTVESPMPTGGGYVTVRETILYNAFIAAIACAFLVAAVIRRILEGVGYAVTMSLIANILNKQDGLPHSRLLDISGRVRK